LYGEDSLQLIFTKKNVGTCFLALGSGQKAIKCFKDCIELQNINKFDPNCKP